MCTTTTDLMATSDGLIVSRQPGVVAAAGRRLSAAIIPSDVEGSVPSAEHCRHGVMGVVGGVERPVPRWLLRPEARIAGLVSAAGGPSAASLRPSHLLLAPINDRRM